MNFYVLEQPKATQSLSTENISRMYVKIIKS